jgi:hypothetical protein
MKQRPVICIDDGRIYRSISLAARCYHIQPAAISNVISGKIKRAAGRRFSYASAAQIRAQHRAAALTVVGRD